MKHLGFNSARLLHKLCLVAAAALAATGARADFADSRFYNEIILSEELGGASVGHVVNLSNSPLAGSLSDSSLSALNGRTAVDLGVLKASASSPRWDGQASTYYQALAATGYRDTLTFGQSGGGLLPGGLVPVSFTFAFDGLVTGNALNGRLELRMTLSAPMLFPGSASNYNYFVDGSPYSGFTVPNAPCFNSTFYGSSFVCSVTNGYGYTSTGQKSGTASFTFLVPSGQAVNVWSFMQAKASTNEDAAEAAAFDFSHTATLTSIVAPPGTAIFSQYAGSMVAANGGVTYAQALATAVPEPSTNLMLLAGVGVLGLLARRRLLAAA